MKGGVAKNFEEKNLTFFCQMSAKGKDSLGNVKACSLLGSNNDKGSLCDLYPWHMTCLVLGTSYQGRGFCTPGSFCPGRRQSVSGGILLLLFIALSHSACCDESEHPLALLKKRTSWKVGKWVGSYICIHI